MKIMSILKLVALLFVVLLKLFVNGAVGCFENERHALLQLKASLVLDDTSLLTTWDSKSDGCCAWEGIGCSNHTGHIEMFHLSTPQFARYPGEINASLLELRHLKYLNFSGNRIFFNTFPDLFGSLTNLRFLDLKASFSGGRIPNNLAHLSHLQYLDLSYNYLVGTIPHQLGNLSHLQYLDLSDNSLDGTIPHQLGSLSKLQELHLENNDGLKFDDNNSHVGGQWLSNLTLLTHLDLSGILSLNSSHVWLQKIAKLPKIQELKLSACALSDLYLHSLSHSLINFSTSLAILDLSSNTFSSSKIFEWVFNATSNLIELDLSGNNFNGTIPYDFGNIRNHLERLDLSLNELQGGIPESIRHMCTLQSLYLEENYLNEDISTILHKLSGCARYSLQHLSLSYNQITGPLPNLSTFPSLITIDLSYNMLNGKIPDGISNSLEFLIFESNSLEGGIPKSFGNLCSLRSLELSNNKLSEDLSVILHNLSSGCAKYSLLALSLDSNQIIGTVPDMSMFSSLRSLILSNNSLNGRILTNSTFPYHLESLLLDSNNLEGGIPKSFGNLCSLRSLELSSNKLSEDLSVILHNLSSGCAKDSLHELYLGSNQIIGTVPDMSMFSSLRTLRLSNNSLNGRILQNSTFPYQLESLYLDSNNLEGVITESHFGNMSLLKDLYMNGNSLSLIFHENWVPAFQLNIVMLSSCMLGPSFPKWLQSQKHLQQIDISNAEISDVAPVWFWTQTKYLSFMNISYNNLFGTIPNLPIRYSESCEVILDSNQFEGSIPLFLQTATFLRLSENKFSETRLLLCSNNTIDRLQLLDISKNQLSKQLHDCWSHLKSLVFLDLSDNTLSGEVPSSLGSLLALRVLILRNNTFTGKLPVSFINCTRLVMLDVGENRFSGPIPCWLGQQLQMVSLRQNQFYGGLPQCLCDLSNIQLLDLSENNLSGRVFKCFTNFYTMSQKVSLTTSLDLPIILINPYTHLLRPDAYDLTTVLMWKGVERQFKNNKLILRSIDLSSNQLIGDIPKEIGNLIELVSLNLSSNNLTGEITSEIGKLTSLEFLDLSQNHFFGPIPQSLTQIDRLTMLDLSDNNLSGRIPISTQLQSFNASSYEGNVDLCGKPLDRKCPGDEEAAHQKPESSPEDKKPIYVSVALGFITGFWGLWGSLFLIRTWRHTYVLFLNNIVDTMYVFMVLNGIKFQRWLRALQVKFF